jgi:hypothetical protein
VVPRLTRRNGPDPGHERVWGVRGRGDHSESFGTHVRAVPRKALAVLMRSPFSRGVEMRARFPAVRDSSDCKRRSSALQASPSTAEAPGMCWAAVAVTTTTLPNPATALRHGVWLGLRDALSTVAATWQVWSVVVVLLLAALAAKLHEARRLERSGIADVDRMDGRTFEEYLGALFRRLGYSAEVTPYSGDYGADLVIERDGVAPCRAGEALDAGGRATGGPRGGRRPGSLRLPRSSRRDQQQAHPGGAPPGRRQRGGAVGASGPGAQDL